MAVAELDNYDEVRRKFLNHERLVKNIELQRLDDQINKKVSTALLNVYFHRRNFRGRKRLLAPSVNVSTLNVDIVVSRKSRSNLKSRSH